MADKDPAVPWGSATGKTTPASELEAQQRRQELKRGRLILRVAVGVAVLALLVDIPLTWRALRDPGGPSGCQGLLGVRLSSNGTPGRYTLSPRVPDQVNQLGFGASREPDYVTVEFNESGGMRVKTQVNRVLRTNISEFRRADGVRFHNPKSQIYTQAIILRRGVVRLNTCFDPGSGRRVVPGTYSGTVTIDDRSLKDPVVVPIQVTLKYPDLVAPFVLVFFAALAATWLKAMSDITTPGLSAWLGKRKNVVALFFGIGAIAAVYASYLHSKEWGTGGLLDVGAVFAAAFAAHLAGLTAHEAGQNSGKPSVSE